MRACADCGCDISDRAMQAVYCTNCCDKKKKERAIKWYLENKEKSKKSANEWNKRNKDICDKSSKKWHDNNKEKVKDAQRKWYLNNKDAVRERSKLWHIENREHKHLMRYLGSSDVSIEIKKVFAIKRLIRMNSLNSETIKFIESGETHRAYE